jgi:hypothetical protein
VALENANDDVDGDHHDQPHRRYDFSAVQQSPFDWVQRRQYASLDGPGGQWHSLVDRLEKKLAAAGRNNAGDHQQQKSVVDHKEVRAKTRRLMEAYDKFLGGPISGGRVCTLDPDCVNEGLQWA